MKKLPNGERNFETSNIQHPTPNVRATRLGVIRCWMLDVGCWMLDVPVSFFTMNFLTELREGLIISWSAIRANKLRSVLTTLGIVIGIVTVTLMGTAIEGLNRSFMNSISSIGADVLYASRRSWFIQSHQEWVNAMKNPAISLADVDSQRDGGIFHRVDPLLMRLDKPTVTADV